jgi:subtilase family serine protease
MCFEMTDKIIEINEDNPNFFKVLKLIQADELI